MKKSLDVIANLVLVCIFLYNIFSFSVIVGWWLGINSLAVVFFGLGYLAVHVIAFEGANAAGENSLETVFLAAIGFNILIAVLFFIIWRGGI